MTRSENAPNQQITPFYSHSLLSSRTYKSHIARFVLKFKLSYWVVQSYFRCRCFAFVVAVGFLLPFAFSKRASHSTHKYITFMPRIMAFGTCSTPSNTPKRTSIPTKEMLCNIIFWKCMESAKVISWTENNSWISRNKPKHQVQQKKSLLLFVHLFTHAYSNTYK